MADAQVFVCGSSGGVRSMFVRNNENALFLKIEDDQISGKGYICNSEGKNGYVDEFSFKVSEMGEVTTGKYEEFPALFIDTKLSGLYGAKKVKIALPQLKGMDLVSGRLKRLKAGSEPQSTTRQGNMPPASGAPVVDKTPAPAPAPTPAGTAQKEENVATLGAQRSASSMQNAQTTSDTRSFTQPQTYVPRTLDSAKTSQPQQMSKRNVADEEDRMASEEFQQKLEKLAVLKDCGLLGEKEFKAKRVELVSQFCNLTDFNEKIQKLVALKDCGLLSDKEFEANRIDIIKECCDIETPDIKAYRRNVAKLSYLEMGEVISAEEYERSKKTLVDDCEFELYDDKDIFARKLQRLPILKENQFVTDEDYKRRMDDLFAMIEVSPDDPIELLGHKLSKWPILEQEGVISSIDLKNKQRELIENYLDTNWSNLDELKTVATKMVAMREGEFLSDMDYFSKREGILRQVDEISDYAERIEAHIALGETKLVTEEEFGLFKQRCIDEIFANSGSMAEFKSKANNLLILQKVGLITSEEFDSYKMKLMSDL